MADTPSDLIIPLTADERTLLVNKLVAVRPDLAGDDDAITAALQDKAFLALKASLDQTITAAAAAEDRQVENLRRREAEEAIAAEESALRPRVDPLDPGLLLGGPLIPGAQQ